MVRSTVHLPPALVIALNRQAAATGMSRAAIVREALRQHLDDAVATAVPRASIGRDWASVALYIEPDVAHTLAARAKQLCVSHASIVGKALEHYLSVAK